MNSIHEICKKCAAKLSDPDFVVCTALKATNKLHGQQSHPWNPLQLTYGYPGLIIFFCEMHALFPNEGWEKTIDLYVQALLKELQSASVIDPSLFLGLGGICYALSQGSQAHHKYVKVWHSLHNQLLEGIVRHFLQPEPGQYDVIYGMSGLIPYLLTFRQDPHTEAVCRRMLHHLVRLTRTIDVAGSQVVGWYTAPRQFLLKEHLTMYPEGFFDTGMAHGIAGPLAALAKAYFAHVIVDGLEPAMEKIIQWLKAGQATVGHHARVWPKRYAFNSEKPHFLQLHFSDYFDGWCYGAPGILSALISAASALKDAAMFEESALDMIQIGKRVEKEQQVRCVSFCHGLASILTVQHQMYLITSEEVFFTQANWTTRAIIEQYRDDLPFGFSCVSSTNCPNTTVWIDNPGLLDGVVGTLLSLLFFTSRTARPWMQLFNLN